MSSIYEKNIMVIEGKWPDIAKELNAISDDGAYSFEDIIKDGELATVIANGKHITSAYDRRREAEIQATIIPENSREIHIYGLGLGDLVDVAINKFPNASIKLYIFNLHIFKYLLGKLDFSNIFSNSNLRIYLAKYLDKILIPYTVSPASIELADRESIRARDIIQIALATPYIREKFNSNNIIWQEHIRSNKTTLLLDFDVKDLFGTMKGKKALVIGAGPSLDTEIEKVKKLCETESVCIAVDGAYTALLKNGISPNYVVTLDGQKEKLEKLFPVEAIESSQNIRLVYFPVIDPKVLNLWKGKRYTAYSEHPIYETARQIVDKGELYVSGSVIHPAVDLAVKMGCSQISLVGCDFSFPGNVTHAKGFYYRQNFEKSGHEKILENGYGEEVSTIQNLIVYLRDLETFIELHPEVEFKNLSKHGARIKGVSY